MRGLFLTLFLVFWKEWIFWSLWLIRIATSNKQFSQSSLEKTLMLIFIQKREWEDFFLHFFWSSEQSEVFWSLWLIRIATSIQTVFTLIIGKSFSAYFHLKTGVREFFLTLSNLSSEKREFFPSLWLIRSATS